MEPQNVLREAAEATAAILERMGIEATVRAEAAEEDSVRVIVEAGERDGVIIGHRGETLASLQHVVNRIVNKNHKSDKDKITLDVADYQERRRLQLVEMAASLAARARESRRDQISEMLPAAERRVVHQEIADMADVTSFSLGDGQMKRMVVALADEEQRIVVEPEDLLANAPRGPRREGDGPRRRDDERGGRGARGGRDRERGPRADRGDRGDRGDRPGRERSADFPPRVVPPSDGRVRDLIKADAPRTKSSFRIVHMPRGFAPGTDEKDADEQR